MSAIVVWRWPLRRNRGGGVELALCIERRVRHGRRSGAEWTNSPKMNLRGLVVESERQGVAANKRKLPIRNCWMRWFGCLNGGPAEIRSHGCDGLQNGRVNSPGGYLREPPRPPIGPPRT